RRSNASRWARARARSASSNRPAAVTRSEPVKRSPRGPDGGVETRSRSQAVDEDHVGASGLHAERPGLAVLLRVVPASGLLTRRELEDDQALRLPVALEPVECPAPDQEPAPVLLEGRGYALPVLFEPRGIRDLDIGDD